MQQLIPATDCGTWRSLLAPLGQVDATCLPEYHLAYSLRIKDSSPFLWHYSEGGHHLVYPFLLTPVMIGGRDTGYSDISGIYGYTGPLATSSDPAFLDGAWKAFDAFTKEKKVIAEFIRFSPFNQNQNICHPGTTVEANRILAASHLPGSEDALLEKLGSKTRNMLRKAHKAGLTARELALPEHLSTFRQLYDETMGRNRAPEFFWYDDAYYAHLLKLREGLRLFGVFAGDRMVAAAMAVAHGQSGLYHLGASLTDYARLGAGNLSLFAMSMGLMQSGVAFINMTGGRTTAGNDPLLLFKKSNATGTATFYIGKRIVDSAAYRSVADAWRQHGSKAPDDGKIIFWRP